MNSVGETAASGFQPGMQRQMQLQQPFPTSSARKYLQLIMMFSVTEHIKAKLTEALEQLTEDSKNTGFLFFSSKDKKQNDP